MIRLFIVAIVFLCSNFVWAYVPGQSVRIRIHKNIEQLKVSGLGLRVSRNGYMRVMLETRKSIPASKDEVLIEGESLKLNGQPAPNRVYFKNGSVVAEMDLEQYLKGVVASEMPASWPFEALKAQAVASRSYAMNVVRERQGKFFHLEATVMNQVFDYPRYKGLLKVYKDKVERVIEETRGEYLVWKKSGRPFKSYYHAHCGGGTEEPSHVWGPKKKNGVTRDTGCSMDRRGDWQLSLDEDELKERLLPELIHREDLQISLIEKDELSKYGRAKRVRIYLGDKEVVFPSNEFRKRIGFSQLKSTRFEIEKRGAHYKFTGKGYGHGAGLCQAGARFMAMGSASYVEILRKYYPKTLLRGQLRTQPL